MIIKKWHRISIHKYAYHTYVGDSLFNIDELTKYCKEPVFFTGCISQAKRQVTELYVHVHVQRKIQNVYSNRSV